MKTIKNDKIFKITDNAEVRCSWFKTNYGFKHEAELYYDGLFQCSAKVCYYNRTWESFEYETVLGSVLRKAHFFDDSVAEIISRYRNKNIEEVNQQFSTIAGLAKMGELLSDDKKEQNDWKKRMLDAGLSGLGLDMPDNWDSLSEDDKERRLNSVITMLDKPIK
jgi:hypothetical protein